VSPPSAAVAAALPPVAAARIRRPAPPQAQHRFILSSSSSACSTRPSVGTVRHQFSHLRSKHSQLTCEESCRPPRRALSLQYPARTFTLRIPNRWAVSCGHRPHRPSLGWIVALPSRHGLAADATDVSAVIIRSALAGTPSAAFVVVVLGIGRDSATSSLPRFSAFKLSFPASWSSQCPELGGCCGYISFEATFRW
jgi:hypothetical protein